MARWPQVPDVYDWLSLDRRGRWLLRGETIGNAALRAFISRNYMAVDDGCYIFQNGPQRVFVELAYTPWVVSLDAQGGLRLHTGVAVPSLRGAWMDEHGALLLDTPQGVALLDDRDLEVMAERLVGPAGEAVSDERRAQGLDAVLRGDDAALALASAGGPLPLLPIRSTEVAARFGFRARPAAPEG